MLLQLVSVSMKNSNNYYFFINVLFYSIFKIKFFLLWLIRNIIDFTLQFQAEETWLTEDCTVINECHEGQHIHRHNNCSENGFCGIDKHHHIQCQCKNVSLLRKTSWASVFFDSTRLHGKYVHFFWAKNPHDKDGISHCPSFQPAKKIA